MTRLARAGFFSLLFAALACVCHAPRIRAQEPAPDAQPAADQFVSEAPFRLSHPDLPPLVPALDLPVDYNSSFQPRNAGTYLWPAVDVIAINVTMWSLPWVLGVEWAQIGPDSWEHNLKSGLQWDDNEFEVNQFGHPYQGGLYFTAARMHGLNFWESVPYTLGGSLMWEYFMETEEPSTNDWMTTTWGGFFFGEALYRLSNNILDEAASGGERFWREFAAFAVNPVNGIDRLISGRAWANGPRGKTFPIDTTLRIGPDGLGLSSGTGWGKTFRLWVQIEYGDLYAKPEFDTPFEYFDFSAQLSFGEDILGQSFDGTGALLGTRFSMGKGNVDLFAWVLTYQYFTNGTTKMLTRDTSGVYQLGKMGTGPAWFGHWHLASGFSIDTELQLLFVPVGAITSPYAKFEANRAYNYGIGGSTRLEINLRHRRLGRVYAQMDRYLYYIVDGASGVEHLGVLQLGVYANVYRGHGLGFAAIRYDRNSYYHDYPDLFDAFWSGQAQYEVVF
ncbi:MAG TPA: DUF3943 domain-containing protein [Polyangiales bacterium]|nr:DUF3943 domain-containing protein [Polyangiales bacterium]